MIIETRQDYQPASLIKAVDGRDLALHSHGMKQFIMPIALLALAACSPMSPPETRASKLNTEALRIEPIQDPGHPKWSAQLGRNHPLTGKVWSPAEKKFISIDETLSRLVRAKFVLLGEAHDNPDHHRFQALLAEVMARKGRKPAIAFEMMDRDQQGAIDVHVALNPGDAKGLGEAVSWSKRGWPAWPHYAQIVAVALKFDLPILAANLPRALTKASTQPGGLGPEWSRLDLDGPMPSLAQEAMKRDIERGHCSMLPESAVSPMLRSQRARDGAMALTLAEALEKGKDGGVLIAGAGHARKDYAVPWHLARLAPGASVISLAMVEVHDEETDPAAYGGAFDLMWFTPRANDDDHCADMAKHMQKMKEKPAEKKAE